jgi:hypothetical protein
MATPTTRRKSGSSTQARRSRPEKLLVLMIRMLADRESKPFMKQQVALQTSHTQHVFRRVYDKLSHALYRTDEVLMTVDAKMAARIQAVVDKNYQKLYDDLSKEEMRLDSLQEAEGISGEICYTSEKEETATIFSPRAMRFVVLMRTLDRIINKIDLLHISGIIDTTPAALAKWTWQRRVIAFANEIIMASNTAVQKTRQQLIERTRLDREKHRQRMEAAQQAEETDRDADRESAEHDMPAPHEVDHALAMEIPDVEAVPDLDDDGDLGSAAPKRATRTARAAAAAVG